MPDPILSFTRIKSALAGDAYKWLTNYFLRGKFDASDNLISVVNPRNNKEFVLNYPIRTDPVRYVTFGDSTGTPFEAKGGANDTQYTEIINQPIGASGSTYQIVINKNRFMLQDFYPKAILVGSCGISGQTTTQMLAREAFAYSSIRRAVADVFNCQPDIISYRGLSINNFINGAQVTSSTWQVAAANCIADAQLIIRRLKTVNVPIIVHGIYAYSFPGNDVNMSAGVDNAPYVRLALLSVNMAIKNWISTLTDVYFLDPQEIGIQDSNGYWLTKYQIYDTQDGIHPSGLSGEIIFTKESEIITPIFGRSESYTYSGINQLTNELFANTSSGSGVFPTGFNYVTTNCTFADRQIETINNKIWHTGTLTVTAAGQIFAFTLPTTTWQAALQANESRAIEFDWFIQNISGDLGALTVLERLDISKTGAGRLVYDSSISGGVVDSRVHHCSKNKFLFNDPGSSFSNFLLRLQVTQSALLPANNQQYKIGISLPRVV